MGDSLGLHVYLVTLHVLCAAAALTRWSLLPHNTQLWAAEHCALFTRTRKKHLLLLLRPPCSQFSVTCIILALKEHSGHPSNAT